jgi:hypothetical protein
MKKTTISFIATKNILGHWGQNLSNKDNIPSLEPKFREISNRIPVDVNFKNTNGLIAEICSKLQYKILFDGERITIETEYLPITVVLCSYLNTYKIDYDIKYNTIMSFKDNGENLVEIYPSSTPTTMLSKRSFDMKDTAYDINLADLEFKFDNSILKSSDLTPKKLEDAFVESLFIYGNSTQTECESCSILKNDISRIKFTELGYKKVSEQIKWLRDLFNIKFENVEEALEY